MHQYTVGDLTLTLPDEWQQDPDAPLAALFQRDKGTSLLAIQRFPLAEADDAAVEEIMAQFIEDDYEEISRQAVVIAGQPALVVVSQWANPDQSVRTQQAVVISRPHEILAIIGMTDEAERDMPLFADMLGASDALSLASALSQPPSGRHHDAELGLSLDVPEGWSVMRTEDFPLHIFAPEEAGYRASFAVGVMELSQPSPELLDALVEDYYIKGNNDLGAYQLIQSQALTVNDQPGYTIHHEWQEDGLHFTELDAYIYSPPQQAIRLHGYTLKQLELKYFPIFAKMLDSVIFD
jgi:hypothetical protein